MKPYLLVTGDFVKTGGMDRANFALADYLSRQGESVHLVAYRVDQELLDRPNVNFHRVPKVANSYLISGFLLNQVGRHYAQHLVPVGGCTVSNGGSCNWGDVNWVHYVHSAYQPTSQSALLQQLKLAISHQVFLATERQALGAARVIITNSERTKQDLIAALAIPPERIHVVYYGIDPQLFRPATLPERAQLRRQLNWSVDQPVVIFIGALGDRRKGFDTLFAAWRQLCTDSGWDANLVVIGSGAELAVWQSRVVETGLEHRIQFLGFRSDVSDLLRAADCLVAPTRYEAYGLGVHEALCCGLPAIVSAGAGVAERYPVSLQDLLMLDPSSVDELVVRLRLWRHNSLAYYEALKLFSQELRCYTWNDMAQSLLARV